MRFGINNPSFLQSAGNAGGKIDERFCIKALEDNTEVEFLYPEQTLMSTDGVEYVRATNTTINAGDKLYMYTDGTITYPEDAINYDLISVSKGFAAEGLVPLSTIYFGDDQSYEERMILRGSRVIDASKVVVLADGSCEALFEGCTSLVNAPELPAKTLVEGCYSGMFSGCTSLVNAPELPATELSGDCYREMFYGCTSLVNAPELPATELKDYCYGRMFEGCTSLVNAPELPAKTLVEGCYSGMFSGCTSLVNAPELPATNIKSYIYTPSTEPDPGCYGNMFSGCTSLVNAPELPATELQPGCYAKMFSGCTSLVNAPKLPATELKDYCYSYMFSSCESLVNAPKLPATTLVESCYERMFYRSRVNNIICLATNISEYNCTYDWLSITDITGTFTKADGMNDWPTGGSGIPEGWTVQEYAGDDFEVGEL